MNGRDDRDLPPDCRTCRGQLQEYLDGTLDKAQSLTVFLHVRDCAPCDREMQDLRGLFAQLAALPDHPAPADFDEAVLASVPYASYRAMEPLRRPRVPVFLEQEALPAFVRSLAVRRAGLGLAVACAAAALLWGRGGVLMTLAAVGILPEALVRLQNLGRRAVLAVRRSES